MTTSTSQLLSSRLTGHLPCSVTATAPPSSVVHLYRRCRSRSCPAAKSQAVEKRAGKRKSSSTGGRAQLGVSAEEVKYSGCRGSSVSAPNNAGNTQWCSGASQETQATSQLTWMTSSQVDTAAYTVGCCLAVGQFDLEQAAGIAGGVMACPPQSPLKHVQLQIATLLPSNVQLA
jgi:hypothetical protein